jgi:predicted nucleotidyltransferase
MINPEQIDEVIEILIEHLQPQQIYVCGSYSVGTATDDSDLDLLVVQDSEAGASRRIRNAEHALFGLMLPIDLTVCTPAELAEDKQVESSFLKNITERQGWLVYDRERGGFRELHRAWSAAPSAETHQRLAEDPGEWQLYQSLYRRARRSFSEQPREVIARELRAHPEWTVGDFGCGDALLAESLPNQVVSMDHLGTDPSIVVCDIAETPLCDGVLDAAVFALSLVGANWPEYLREAHRTLRPGGRIYVAELEDRWEGGLEPLLSALREAGFTIEGRPRLRGELVYVTGVA